MARVAIDIPKDRIADFCQRHYMTRLSIFGSVLRNDFTTKSDVDVLVEFEPDHVPGLIGLCRMERELSSILGGRQVDLLTPKFLNRRIRARVLSQAQVQYDRS